MIKTVKHAASKILNDAYELPNKAILVLNDFNERYSTEKLCGALPANEDGDSSFQIYLKGSLEWLDRPYYFDSTGTCTSLFGSNMTDGQYLYLQKYILITTQNIESFLKEKSNLPIQAVKGNLLNFIDIVFDTVCKIDVPKFNSLCDLAIRKLKDIVKNNFSDDVTELIAEINDKYQNFLAN